MNPVIVSSYSTIAYSIPVGIWFFGQIVILGDDSLAYEKASISTTYILVLLQILFAILYVPRLCLSENWKTTLPVTAINVCIPLPIFLITGLMGYNSLGSIVLAQTFVLCAGALLIPITIGLVIILKHYNISHILLSSVQIMLTVLLWVNRDVIYTWYS